VIRQPSNFSLANLVAANNTIQDATIAAPTARHSSTNSCQPYLLLFSSILSRPLRLLREQTPSTRPSQTASTSRSQFTPHLIQRAETMASEPTTPVKVPKAASTYTPTTQDPDLRSQINTVLLRDGHISK
jgi:hypothetical protein